MDYSQTGSQALCIRIITMNEHAYIIIYCTVPDKSTADVITDKLIAERLVPCVNTIPDITSVYRWKGEICRDGELLLMMKTRSALFDRISHEIKGIHPYEVPEIIALPLVALSESYRAWIDENTMFE
jgi:periplasmic divalent cation tolerance protein